MAARCEETGLITGTELCLNPIVKMMSEKDERMQNCVNELPRIIDVFDKLSDVKDHILALEKKLEWYREDYDTLMERVANGFGRDDLCVPCWATYEEDVYDERHDEDLAWCYECEDHVPIRDVYAVLADVTPSGLSFEQVKSMWPDLEEDDAEYICEKVRRARVCVEMQSDVVEAAMHDQNESDEQNMKIPENVQTATGFECLKIEPSMENIFGRWYLWKTGLTWSTSQTQFTELLNSNIHEVLTDPTLPFEGIVKYHGMFKGDLLVQIRLNTNPFVCGQLMMYAYPNTLHGFSNNNSVSVLPNSILNCAFETVAELRVPYTAPQSFLVNPSVSGDAYYTRFRVMVWNALRVAEGQPTDHTFSVWINFPDAMLGYKMPVGGTKKYAQEQSHSSILGNILGGLGSAVVGMGIPVVSDIAKVVGGVTGLFDSPIVQHIQEQQICVADVPKICDDFRFLKGQEASELMYEEVNLKKLCKVLTRVYTDSWETADVEGTELVFMPTVLNQKLGTSPNDGYAVPLLEVSRSFAYWRGELRFRFEIIATRFHQGQLLISWTPFGRCTNINQARSEYYVSFDIGKQNVVDMVVPFVYPHDWMDVEEDVWGSVQLWVQNKLVAPQNVATTVDVNVFMAGGDDIDMALPADTDLCVYQSESSSSAGIASLVWKPVSVSAPPPRKMQGHLENRHLLRRARMQYPSGVSVITPAWHLVARLPLFPRNSAMYSPLMPYPAAFFRGGGRWTCVTQFTKKDATIIQANLVERSNLSLPQFTVAAQDPAPKASMSGVVIKNVVVDGCQQFTFEVPAYYGAYANHTQGASSGGVEFLVPEIKVFMKNLDSNLKSQFEWFWSAADDFVFMLPIPCPTRTIAAIEEFVEEDEMKCVELQGDEMSLSSCFGECFGVNKPRPQLRRQVAIDMMKESQVYAGLGEFLAELEVPEEVDVDDETASYNSIDIEATLSITNQLMYGGDVYDEVEYEANADMSSNVCCCFDDVCGNYDVVCSFHGEWNPSSEKSEYLSSLGNFWREHGAYDEINRLGMYDGIFEMFREAEWNALSAMVRRRIVFRVTGMAGYGFCDSVYESMTRFGSVGCPWTASEFYHFRHDLALRVRVLTGDKVLLKMVEQQFGDGFLSKMLRGTMDLFGSLKSKLQAWYRKVRNTLGIAKELAGIAVTGKEWYAKLKKVCEFLAGFFLPAVTATYTAYHGRGLIRGVALAQLAGLALKTVVPDKLEEDEPYFEGSDTDESEGDYESIDGEMKRVEQQGIEDFYGDVKDVAGIVDDMCKSTAKTVISGLGFFCGTDYDTYLRRMTGNMEANSWAKVVATLSHTVIFLVHGKSLNTEWERQRLLELSKVCQTYDSCKSRGAFTARMLDEETGGLPNFSILESLYKQITRIKELATEMPIPMVYQRDMAEITKTYQEAARVKRLEVTQSEPVGVFMAGQPGVGKSMLASAVIPRMLMVECGIKSDSPVFPIPIGEHKFWDNYNQQPYLFFDEFLQAKNSEDALTAIRVISSGKVPVNMAFEKGMEFRSEFFVATSNQKNLNNVNEVFSKDAVKRRFDKHAVEIKVRPAFLLGSAFNYALFEKRLRDCADHTQVTALVDSAWNLQAIDLTAHACTPSNNVTYTVSEFVKSIAKEYRSRKEAFEKVTKKLTAVYQMMTSEDDWDASTTNISSSVMEEICMNDEGYSEIERQMAMKMRPVDVVGHHLPDESDNDKVLATSARHLRLELMEIANRVLESEDEGPETMRMFVELAYSTIQMRSIEKTRMEQFWGHTSTPFQEWGFSPNLVKTPGRANGAPYLEVLDWAYQKRTTTSKKRWIGLVKIFSAVGVFAAGITGALVAGVMMLRKMNTTLQSYTGDRVVSSMKKVGQPLKLLKAVTQMDNDVRGKIRRNMCCVELNVFEGENCLCSRGQNALFLDDRTLLVNTHFVTELDKWRADPKKHVTVSWYRQSGDSEHKSIELYPIPIEVSNAAVLLRDGVSQDLTMVKLREGAKGARNIWNFIPLASEANLVAKKQECVMMGGEGERHGRDDMSGVITKFESFSNVPGVYLSTVMEEMTQKGDCGRPYVVKSAAFPRPLVGFHANGILNEKRSGATPLVYEELRELEKKIIVKPIVLDQADDEIVVDKTQSKYWDDRLLPIYGPVVCNGVKMIHHQPLESNLKRVVYKDRLLLHPEQECDFEPAAQRIVGDVHPLISNSQKYAPNCIVTPSNLLHRTAVDYYVSKFEKADIHDEDRKTLSLHEAINGNDSLQALVFKTGCGYWNHFGFKEGKKDFFVELPQQYDPCGEAMPIQRELSAKAKQHVVPIWDCTFEERLKKCEEDCRNGKLFTTFWISTTKDELRPRAKVVAGKTRVFEQPGLEYVLLVRKYFGSFLGWFKKRSGFTFAHGIGQDREVVWGAYGRALLDHSSVGHAFDYSNWDGSVRPSAFEFFTQVTDAFYADEGSEEQKARHVLVRVLRDAHHIMGKFYFHSGQGNKSGNPFTDVFNSVTNTYVVLITYLVCKSMQGGIPDLSEFDEHVKMLTYGDDLVMTVKPNVIGWFSGPQIQAVMGSIGYKVTDALKSGVIADFCTFDELTFLKSPFKLDEDSGLWLAPLPFPDIYKELKYAPKQVKGDEEDIRQRVSVTQRFMAHHGPESLARFQGQLRERGIPRAWLTLSYSSFLEELAVKQASASIY